MKALLRLTFLIFVVGLVGSCKKKAETVKTSAPEKAAVSKGKTYNIDPSSTLNWTGSKIGGKHSGTIGISKGNLTFEDDKLTAVKVGIDMNSITNTDMEAGKGKTKLENHLKNADFFDVSNHPMARFQLTKATKLLNNEKANHLIYGNLIIKEISKQIQFPANVTVAGDVVTIATDDFNIDRTEWDIQYGSKKFFDNLKDKAINDEIAISFSITAR